MAINQLRVGASLSYVIILLSNIIGLFLTPFILSNLGKPEYGLYTLIGAFVGYLTLLDFGLNNTVVRFVAKHRAEKDKKGEESFIGMCIVIYITIAILIAVIGSLCYFRLDVIFSKSLNVDELEKAKFMFVVLIINLALSLPGNSFSAIAFGYEKFVFPRAANIIKYLSRSVLVIVILNMGAKSIGLVLLDSALNLSLIIANGLYVFGGLKVKVSFKRFSWSSIRTIFSYSIWIFIFAIVSQFQWKSGQMVLGVLANTTMVAVFAVGIMLGSYYGAFSSAITSVFLPRATQMTVDNVTGDELTDMMIRIGRLSFIILMYIFGGFLLFGKQFVVLWVGVEFIESWQIAMLIMIAYTTPLVQGFGNSILEAKGKLSFKAILYLTFVAIGTGCGALMVSDLGATGMVLGSSLGWMLSQIIMNIYYSKVIGLNVGRFFKELFKGTLVSVLVIISLGVLINLVPGNGWGSFILKGILYSLVYISVMWRFGMNGYENQLILGNRIVYSFLNLVKVRK